MKSAIVGLICVVAILVYGLTRSDSAPAAPPAAAPRSATPPAPVVSAPEKSEARIKIDTKLEELIKRDVDLAAQKAAIVRDKPKGEVTYAEILSQLKVGGLLSEYAKLRGYVPEDMPRQEFAAVQKGLLTRIIDVARSQVTVPSELTAEQITAIKNEYLKFLVNPDGKLNFDRLEKIN